MTCLKDMTLEEIHSLSCDIYWNNKGLLIYKLSKEDFRLLFFKKKRLMVASVDILCRMSTTREEAEAEAKLKKWKN